MAVAGKRRPQQQLFDKHGRATWRDGKRVRLRRRRKPGRKPKGPRAGSPHKRRPALDPRYPVHVVLRVVDAVGSLRKRHMYKALREATISVALRELHDRPKRAFRIIHISIQHNHVHLIVEADNKTALSRGMQSFQISAAKHLNRAVTIASMKAARSGLPLTREQRRELSARRRRGTVFPDRFHQEIITTPKQARQTLAYVLNNWRKHREDRGALERTWNVYPYSTGVLFDGWKERENEYVLWRWRDTYDPLVVYLPKTWLLRESWRRHGLVGFRDVPSAKQAAVVRVDAAA